MKREKGIVFYIQCLEEKGELHMPKTIYISESAHLMNHFI